MERRHDLGSAGPTKAQVPSRGQRVPTGVPSMHQRAGVVIPRGSTRRAKRTELSEGRVPRRGLSIRRTR
jgi:hypothetical protein